MLEHSIKFTMLFVHHQISDFGMARDLEEETYYVSQSTVMVPVKWTAPEVLIRSL